MGEHKMNLSNERIVRTLHSNKWLFAFFFLAIALRFLYFFLFKTPDFYADGYVYTNIMHFLFDGAPIAKGTLLSWAPGYSVFLKLLSLFVGENLVSFKALQMLLSALTIFPIYWISRKAFSARAGIAAAAIWTLYPYSMLFGELIMSETLFVFVMACTMVALMKAVEKPTVLHSLVAGVFLGILALTRASSKGLFLVVPLFLLWSKKWKPVLALVSIIAAVLVISPYIFFLFQTYNQFIFIDNVGEHTLLLTTYSGYEEINPDVNQGGLYDQSLIVANERPLLLYVEAIPKLLARPDLLLKNVFDRVTLFFWLETFMAGQPTRNYYGAVSSTLAYNVFAYGSILYYIALMLLFVAGAAFSKSRYSGLFFVMILYFVVVHGFSHAEQRYHLQIMPLVIPFAGFALVNLKSIFKKAFDFKLQETKIFYALLAALFVLWTFGFYNFILN